ncbi:MAG: class A beta-lactamase-related serine hydrolase [Phenylobacterium sp.]|uniref:serine hydrolase n=1 Tax=Phenylobacterium sp. TaxID=1871053 RepID=UPI0025CDEFC9|nr:serine hydrolase [Phenylobacterium sp.]MCG9917386.1 class A beta-lactamase-related serine hydrolase [Phenylobacterium sp.]
MIAEDQSILQLMAARKAGRLAQARAQRRFAVGTIAGVLSVCAFGTTALTPATPSPGAGERPMAQWASLRLPPPIPQPPAPLAAQIAALGAAFDGRAGIAVRDLEGGWTATHDGEALYPQQSVSKLWVAISVLDAVDRGVLSLSDPVTVRREDLSIFHQPIRDHVGRYGYRTTVGDLLSSAASRSDNAANDVLIRLVGGPDHVRAVIAERELGAISLADEERYFQTAIAGLDWRPEFSFGRNFWRARAAMPQDERRAALEAYLSAPADGATPAAVVKALDRLAAGDLLSEDSTALLLDLMGRSQTGPDRLAGGLVEGWHLAHKTGTGQVLGARATGYNDVGLLTAPDGRTYAVAVFIADTTRSVPERQALMQAVTRAVIAQHHGHDPRQSASEDFNLLPLAGQETADLELRGNFPAP